jgi:hypothetical protein
LGFVFALPPEGFLGPRGILFPMLFFVSFSAIINLMSASIFEVQR